MSTFRAAFRSLVLTAGALSALLTFARPAAADDELTVITGAQPNAFYQVLDYTADYGGFYKAEHLTIVHQFAGNPTIAAQLIASGKGDIGAEALQPLIAGYDKGVHLQVFFLRSPASEYVLGVPADSPIKTLADFKGTVLGEYSVASSAEIYVNSMLLGAGLHRSDFSYLPIGNGAQAIQALNSKRVAGAAFPFLELMFYVVNADQKYRYFYNPLLRDIGDTGYVATPATIASKADQLERYCRASAKAAIFIRTNPQVAARWYLQGAGLKVTDDAVAKEAKLLVIAQDLLPGYDPMNKRIGNVSLLGMNILSKAIYDNGVTGSLVPASAIATSQFIEFANDFDHRAVVDAAKATR
jgi:NitT/TauT family transport system substrate-binding protein